MKYNKWYTRKESPIIRCYCIIMYKNNEISLPTIHKCLGMYCIDTSSKGNISGYFCVDDKAIRNECIISWMPIKFPKSTED